MSLLDTIKDKIFANQRITFEEGVYLYERAPLSALGYLANYKNRQLNKSQVFYNINRHINPTNICVLSCKFCSFSRKPGDAGAYAFTNEEILMKAEEAVAQKATEVHMVGGLHPRWSFDHYLSMIESIKQKYPKLHIKAFTAVELDWFARKTRSNVEDILKRLIDAGLGSIPGGGAEIFHPEIREQICDTKVPAEQWLATHETAHSLGLHSNATMLYGHIEEYKHRIDHMDRLRTLQDKTSGFNAFIPLSFQPHDNDMGITRYTYGSDDLRTIAVARLYLDNFQHIKSYWVMMGHDIAQMGLEFGANDLDGTVVEEKISKMAGGRSGMVMTQSYIHNLIENTNSVSVERDTIYQAIQSFDRQPSHQVSELLKPFMGQDISKLLNNLDETVLIAQAPKLVWQNSSSTSSTNLKTFHLVRTAKLDMDWQRFESDFGELDDHSGLFVTADDNVCAASYFRAVIILKSLRPNCSLNLDFETLPCLNPSRSGKASNQNPRFKIASILHLFPCDTVVLSTNYDQPFFNILEAEITESYTPKAAVPLANPRPSEGSREARS